MRGHPAAGHAHEAEDYREIAPGRVEVTHFRQQPLPLFLEGFVHALRVARPDEVQALYDAVRRSALYDDALGMFRLNVPLGEDALDLGRIGVFNYGWLENGSIFLHMHYKFVLEMVRRGLLAEFHGQIDRLLVAFRDPAESRRNPAESSSFLVSSGFAIDPRQHGRGCVARLSGATVELLHEDFQTILDLMARVRPREHLYDYPARVDIEENLASGVIRSNTRLWYDGDLPIAWAYVDTYNNLRLELDRQYEDRILVRRDYFVRPKFRYQYRSISCSSRIR